MPENMKSTKSLCRHSARRGFIAIDALIGLGLTLFFTSLILSGLRTLATRATIVATKRGFTLFSLCIAFAASMTGTLVVTSLTRTFAQIRTLIRAAQHAQLEQYAELLITRDIQASREVGAIESGYTCVTQEGPIIWRLNTSGSLIRVPPQGPPAEICPSIGRLIFTKSEAGYLVTFEKTSFLVSLLPNCTLHDPAS